MVGCIAHLSLSSEKSGPMRSCWLLSDALLSAPDTEPAALAGSRRARRALPNYAIQRELCQRASGLCTRRPLTPASMDPIFIPSRQLHLSFHHKPEQKGAVCGQGHLACKFPATEFLRFSPVLSSDSFSLLLGWEEKSN